MLSRHERQVPSLDVTAPGILSCPFDVTSSDVQTLVVLMKNRELLRCALLVVLVASCAMCGVSDNPPEPTRAEASPPEQTSSHALVRQVTNIHHIYGFLGREQANVLPGTLPFELD